MLKMTLNVWESIEHFKKSENWGDPEKMHPDLLLKLDALRSKVKSPIIVHYGTQGTHATNSQHYYGRAADVSCPSLDLFEFYLLAERMNFNGIGIYPEWDSPGLHLDVRPLTVCSVGARWMRADGEYIALNRENIKLYCGV